MSQSILFDAPGPKGRRRMRFINLIGTLLVLGIGVKVIVALAQGGQLTAEKWLPLIDPSTWAAYLIPGLLNTLRAAALAIIGSIAFGLIFGTGRLSRFWPIRLVSSIVVEFFRAVPVLILMIFFWYLLSFTRAVDATDSPFFAVVIGLTLYNGSVIAELVRSSVTNLPRGQREAALTVGLTRGQSLRIIELPQAITAMMPALISQLVVILKDTALGYIVTYPELLRQARLTGTANGNLIPTLFVAAALFIVVNVALGLLAQWASTRLSSRTGSVAKIGGSQR